ncbi:MAG: bifunctional hydroxymethylpyrimidine kinase/phosphomethylpyrimidine kinase [Deltaproteobacteria bacterium]|jgi:hydroxymethylpyrimidine/phosphomethylpyrimidine kinase|nr:bifunctional hydroxymethylpyrimidine kinase/phosphomethylpyrimidine kinase [Deltaproteobacteria bacterium]
MSDVPLLTLTKALTIATSDSGGGAGIEADLKTFAAFGVYGLCVISGVSAQNTVAVTGLELVSPQLVTLQLKAVFDDIGVDAIKIGLLGNAANTKAVAAFLEDLPLRPPVILDPVMVSATGHTFIDQDAIEALVTLFPLTTLVTPNLPEARALSGVDISLESDYVLAAEKIAELGANGVLIKGGHAHGPDARDLFLGPKGPTWISTKRVQTSNNHGTGCTLSSAIASAMARGESLEEAVKLAKLFVAGALATSIKLGRGPGPLNHFYHFYNYTEVKNRENA